MLKEPKTTYVLNKQRRFSFTSSVNYYIRLLVIYSLNFNKLKIDFNLLVHKIKSKKIRHVKEQNQKLNN